MKVFQQAGPSIGQELLNVPMGDMIRDMAFAIAEAQVRLDENSIEVAEMMGGIKSVVDANDEVIYEDSRVFFGRETMLWSEALEIHNTTSDQDLKDWILDNHIYDSPGGPTLKTEITQTGSSPDTYALSNPGSDDTVVVIPTRLSMLELGFTPTFYQFVDTIIEVKISIKYSRERSTSVETKTNSNTVSRTRFFSIGKNDGKLSVTSGRSKTVTTSQVNATYSSKFNYSAEGSSLLRTKLVPVPPPAILEERIRQQLEAAEAAS